MLLKCSDKARKMRVFYFKQKAFNGFITKMRQKCSLLACLCKKALHLSVLKRIVHTCEVRVSFCLSVPVLVRHSCSLDPRPNGAFPFLKFNIRNS